MLMTLMALALAELPITDVTVFSDRARVVRSGALPLSGKARLELAVLSDTTDTSSINVEVTGAELETVELSPLDEEQLPLSEARALLKQLEDNTDALSKLNGELQAVQQQVAQLRALNPQVPSNGSNAPPPKLSANGWTAAVQFAAEQLTKLQARERELTVKVDELREKRQELDAKAAQLGGAQRRSGWKVVAVAKGSGPARFAVTYVALRARWIPTYDVQLVPDTGKVQVSFAGLVSQETGEDWSDAALTLSTAVPSQANEFPRLLTWKIGTRERFIPTPTPVAETVRPPPAAPPLRAEPREEDRLRASLRGEQTEPVAIDDLRKTAEKRSKAKDRPPPPPPAPPSARYGGMPAPAAAPPPEPMVEAEELAVAEVQISGKSSRSRGPQVRRTGMSLSPPPAWQRPQFSPELPAAAGGGYDLAWPSLQRESVQSGKGARRVALFTQTWPVTTERKLYPALFTESFLVAELKNPASWPLPAGTANLFVGADPAGTASLKLVSPGEKFTLPLGIDRALKPVRNVRVVDAEKGVFSKDDVSEYTVSIQLANPYRAAVAVRLYDQIPVTDDKEVEISLLETKPQAAIDKVRGHLEWRLNVPASSKTEVSFKYTLKRPKGWKMNQWEVAQ